MAADWDLMDEVYFFARDRAQHRLWLAKEHHRGADAIRSAKAQLEVLQRWYAEAKHDGSSKAIAAAIDVFRKHAMKDQDHPDYQSIWTLPER